MKWFLPAGADSALYYGNSIPDSCQRTSIVLYHTALADSATHAGIRWCKFTGEQGHGWLIAADSSLLNLHPVGRQLNIAPPSANTGYHYIYKVTPQ
jgi:hypothetical protein